MKIVFFSDTHLDKERVKRTEAVETFLREECADADIIFLLGDIFEFYHGHSGIYPWFLGVADALKGLTDRGKTVYFLEGNHEFGMGKFFASCTGVVTCRESMSIDVEGKRLFVAHGDQFTGGMLRLILKARCTGIVMDLLGPRLTWAGAMAAGVVLSKPQKIHNKAAVGAFRGYARKKLDEGFDVVILAHSHAPDRVESGPAGQRKIYLNTGDFFAFSSYASYETAKGFELKRHPYGKRRAHPALGPSV
jgi:UDP-2,3-diacylglucosamine hydrolase